MFATSKQYSDKLSVDVSRGITGAIRDGKYVGVIKKGYYVDLGTGYFLPDTQNWQLLRRAVLMRLKDDKTNQEVANLLNSSGFSYRKHQEDEYKKSKLNKKTVAKLLSDPFYCGVYECGKNYANLHEIYNFVPLVTTDEHIVLSKNTADTFNKEYAGRTTNAKDLSLAYCVKRLYATSAIALWAFNEQNLQRVKTLVATRLASIARIKSVCDISPKKQSNNSEQAYKQYIGRLEQQLEVDRAIARRKVSEAKTDLNKEQNNYAK